MPRVARVAERRAQAAAVEGAAGDEVGEGEGLGDRGRAPARRSAAARVGLDERVPE